jgi:murein DD-endopeptidase MepM/ murein hydrolase activator NlpD
LKRTFIANKFIATKELDIDAIVEKEQPVNSGNAKTYSSVAMFGIAALSVGASGVMLPHGGDQVLAADPPTADITPNVESSYHQDIPHILSQERLSSTHSELAVNIPESSQSLIRQKLFQDDIVGDVSIDSPHTLTVTPKLPTQEPSLNKFKTLPKVDPISTTGELPQSIAMARPNLGLNSYPFSSEFIRSNSSNSNGKTPTVEPLPSNLTLPGKNAGKSRVNSFAESATNQTAPSSQIDNQLNIESPDQQSAEWVKEESVESFIGVNKLSNQKSLENLAPSSLELSAQPEIISANLSQVKPDSQNNISTILYQVQPGDTLEMIASSQGITVEDLIKFNQISDPNYLTVDQYLKIPKSVQTEIASVAAINQEILGTANLSANTAIDSMNNTAVTEPLADINSPVNAPVVEQTIVSSENTTITSTPVMESSISASKTEAVNKFAETNWEPELRQNLSANLSSQETGNSITSNMPSNNIAARPYGQRLRSEMLRLREEYGEKNSQTSQTVNQVNQVTTVAVEEKTVPVVESSVAILPIATTTKVPIVANTVNVPEANTARNLVSQTTVSRPEISQANLPNGPVLESPLPLQSEKQPVRPIAPARVPTTVAVAPNKATAEEILNNPAIGRIVSPKLPPLDGADTYLPGGTLRFNGFIWPARGQLSSPYGWRWGRMHYGIDIAADIGTPIYAAAPGVVITAGWDDGGYGNLVEIKHPNGAITVYAHNDQIYVRQGQQVAQGETIAAMGSTGRSTGPHLHFEIVPNGQGAVDPMAYLPADMANR